MGVESVSVSLMLTLLKSLVISLLEYCCQLWNPCKAKDIKAIEAIQRTFTYKITEVQHLNYWERLHELKLYPFQRRRERYMLVRKFSFAPIEAKIQLFESYCYPIYGCALWRHSFQNSIRKLTVSYRDTFKRLINVPRYASSSLAFAMNATDHINVVFQKFAYSLMSRVIASPTSIVTAVGVLTACQ